MCEKKQAESKLKKDNLKTKLSFAVLEAKKGRKHSQSSTFRRFELEELELEPGSSNPFKLLNSEERDFMWLNQRLIFSYFFTEF